MPDYFPLGGVHSHRKWLVSPLDSSGGEKVISQGDTDVCESHTDVGDEANSAIFLFLTELVHAVTAPLIQIDIGKEIPALLPLFQDRGADVLYKCRT